MIYLISFSDCVVDSGVFVEIKANAKYRLENIEDKFINFINKKTGRICAVNFFKILNGFDLNENIKVVKFRQDIYCFLDLQENRQNYTFNIFDETLVVEISNHIYVKYAGDQEKIILEKDIKFSHIDRFGKIMVLYFDGERNFTILLNEEKILFAGFYDELKVDKDELAMLCKVNDSINHGWVVKIAKQEFEKYLVYLDDNEMKLKEKFLLSTFMDCVLVENFKYLKNLLDESLVDQVENLKLFFEGVKEYFVIDENHCVVMKKDAQMDIFEFSILKNKVINITVVDC